MIPSRIRNAHTANQHASLTKVKLNQIYLITKLHFQPTSSEQMTLNNCSGKDSHAAELTYTKETYLSHAVKFTHTKSMLIVLSSPRATDKH
jgi:hypothetical protein